MAGLLDHALDPANLRLAWEEIAAKHGMPGVDEVSIRRWGRNWEERLVDLAAAVRGNTYRPARLRQRWIPKASGGQRRISVPTVTDRVLQRAVLQALTPALDRRFLSCSFGYRPRRSLHHAVAKIISYRERGLVWVLDADIDGFFDHIDHELLLGFVRQDVPDAALVRLIGAWVRGYAGRSGRGIPLGAVISPLLSNLYLHRMDCALVRGRWPLVRYADDFVVLTSSQASALRARAVVAGVLADLRLALKESKTRITDFARGFDFLGVRFQGDGFSYLWREKRISVQGSPSALFWRYGPEGYE